MVLQAVILGSDNSSLLFDLLLDYSIPLCSKKNDSDEKMRDISDCNNTGVQYSKYKLSHRFQ